MQWFEQLLLPLELMKCLFRLNYSVMLTNAWFDRRAIQLEKERESGS